MKSSATLPQGRGSRKTKCLVRRFVVASILILFGVLQFRGNGQSTTIPMNPTTTTTTTTTASKKNHSLQVLPVIDHTTNNSQENRSQYYCEWITSLDQCYHRLRPLVKDTQHWVLLGDSTMRLLARVRKKKRNHVARCGNVRYPYLGCSSNGTAQWVPPNPSRGEGPVRYGLKNPTCMDCNGCGNYKVIGIPDTTSFEYIGVDSARDVELPCPSFHTTTTQQTVAHYLGSQNRTGWTTCLVNSGLHDMSIPNNTLPLYIQNVLDYLRLLQPACHRIIWLGMSATAGDPAFPQNNTKLYQWNVALYARLAREFPHDVVVMDVYEKTKVTDHPLDNVHLSPEYYQELFQFFFKNLTTFLWRT